MLKIYYRFHNHVAVSFGLYVTTSMSMYVFSNDVKRGQHSVQDALSKGLSGSKFSVDDNLYLTSIGSTGSGLYSNLKEEYFIE